MVTKSARLSGFIRFLGILLICILIANSILASLYVQSLKNRMADLTDHYLRADRLIQTALLSLNDTRTDLLKYGFLVAQKEKKPDFNRLEEELRIEFRKNQVNVSFAMLTLERMRMKGSLGRLVSDAYLSITQYTLYLENLLSSEWTDSQLYEKNIQPSLSTYVRLKHQLENVRDALRQKAYDVHTMDNTILSFFPSILFASFVIALVVGGAFILVSRRHVRQAIFQETSQILSEAYQYQQDCLQTLEICKELTHSIHEEFQLIASHVADDSPLYADLQSALKSFSALSEKTQNAFAARMDFHRKDKANIEQVLHSERLQSIGK